MTIINNNNTTSYLALPVPKWSVSTILKLMEAEYWETLKEILDKDDITKEEKNRRIDGMLECFLEMYNGILNYGLTVKK